MMTTSPSDVEGILEFGYEFFVYLTGRGMWSVWGRGEVHTGFWWRHLWGRYHFEDLGLHVKIILKLDIQEVWWDGVDCIDLSQDRDQWRGVVNAVMNILLCKNQQVHISKICFVVYCSPTCIGRSCDHQ
jgi:hypothetical protein